MGLTNVGEWDQISMLALPWVPLTAMIPVCPKCHARLFLLMFKGVEVDYCNACRGIWLDAGEMEELAAQFGGHVAHLHGEEAGRATKAMCPRCDARLREFPFEHKPDEKGMGGVLLKLDRCPLGHGLWFDAGELQQVLGAFAEGAGSRGVVAFFSDLFGVASGA